MVTVGVLAVQGSFYEHIQLLKSLSSESSPVEAIPVRNPADLARCSGLIIPGGESTSIAYNAEKIGLWEPLVEMVKNARQGKGAIWGTCAGMILLCESVAGGGSTNMTMPQLGGIEASVVRNQYGRQLASFEADLNIRGLDHPFKALFIRAPILHTIHGHVERLCEIDVHHLPQHGPQPLGPDASVVMARAGNVFISSFHPELTHDSRIHRMWLDCLVQGES